MARALFETKDKQLIPLDDIQHINARPNESLREGYETLTIIYKEGMKTTIPAIEYEPLKINSYTFKRENPISSNVILNLDVLYYSSFGNVSNVPVVKWKLADGSYTTIPSSYYTIDSTNHKLTISNYEISNILPYNQQGQFSIYIEDKLTIAEDTGANGLVLKGVATFEAGEHDLQVNGNLYIADINRENKVNVKDLHLPTMSDGGNGWTKADYGGYVEYYKNISVSKTFSASGWGFLSGIGTLPTDISSFNSSTMSFSGNGYADDGAIRIIAGIKSNATSISAVWHNAYAGAITEDVHLNYVLKVYE